MLNYIRLGTSPTVRRNTGNISTTRKQSPVAEINALKERNARLAAQKRAQKEAEQRAKELEAQWRAQQAEAQRQAQEQYGTNIAGAYSQEKFEQMDRASLYGGNAALDNLQVFGQNVQRQANDHDLTQPGINFGMPQYGYQFFSNPTMQSLGQGLSQGLYGSYGIDNIDWTRYRSQDPNYMMEREQFAGLERQRQNWEYWNNWRRNNPEYFYSREQYKPGDYWGYEFGVEETGETGYPSYNYQPPTYTPPTYTPWSYPEAAKTWYENMLQWKID